MRLKYLFENSILITFWEQKTLLGCWKYLSLLKFYFLTIKATYIENCSKIRQDIDLIYIAQRQANMLMITSLIGYCKYLNAIFSNPTAQEVIFFPLTRVIGVQHNIAVSTVKFAYILFRQGSLSTTINAPHLEKKNTFILSKYMN